MKEIMNPERLENYRNKVDLYLDRALNPEESHQVEKDAKTDPQFAKLLESESNFRNLLKDNIERQTCSETLIKNIKNSIRF